MSKKTKKLLVILLTLVMCAGLFPVTAFAEGEDSPSEPQVKIEYGSWTSDYNPELPITITIPEGYEEDEIQVDMLNPNLIANVDVMPGSHIKFNITLVNNSGMNYSYKNDSLALAPFSYDEYPNIPVYGNWENYPADFQVCRVYNTMLQSFSTETNPITNMKGDVTNAKLAPKLRTWCGQQTPALSVDGMDDNQVVNNYLDDYALDFYKYNKSVEDLTYDELSELLGNTNNSNHAGASNSGTGNNIFETNPELNRAGFKLLYYHILTFAEVGTNVTGSEEAYSVLSLAAKQGKYQETQNALQKLATADDHNVKMELVMSGPRAKNFMQNVDFAYDFGIIFTLKSPKNPGLEKKIITGTGENGDSALADHGDYKPKDTVTFQLKSNVPDYLGNYVDGEGVYTLTFHDKLDSGMTYADNITVAVKGKTLDSSLYEVKTEDLGDSCSFHVSMDLAAICNAENDDNEPAYFSKDDINSTPEIIVTYKATVNEGTTHGAYPNESWVEYKDMQAAPQKIAANKVHVHLYAVIMKVTGKNGKPIPGAEYAIYDRDPSAPGNENIVPIATAVSGGDGRLVFEGLLPRRYWLMNTKAPNGYKKAPGVKEVTPVSTESENVDDHAVTEPMALEPASTPSPYIPPSPVEFIKEHYAYIIGYPDGMVHPERDITRAETATIFFRMLTEESRKANWKQENPYEDVNIEDWFNNAVSTLTNAGILHGRTESLFEPDESITRAEFAAMAARFFEREGCDKDIPKEAFPDIKNHWAEEEISLAYSKNLINGYPDGSFKPDQPITRAEAVTIVNRVLERHPHKDHLLKDMIQWPDNIDKDIWYYADMQEATNSHNFEEKGSHESLYENWTEILPVRDWAALEREWSEYNSSASPGEVVGVITRMIEYLKSA